VILTGRNKENLTSLAESIRLRTGTRPETVQLDIADVSAVTLFAKKMRDAGTPIDILINNAAHWLPGRLDESDAFDISNAITGMVTGTLLLTRGLLPLLEKSGAGDIMNIVSISGLANTPLSGASVAFYAAKHAQAGMSDGLRQELRGRPIRVHAIYPPNLEDISPLDEGEWNAARDGHSRATNRDMVETIMFALSRPRHLTLASVVFDAPQGGLS
jgi:NADP-dependent 3-hydroxy acid dehydrogenase YdfG